MKIATYSICVTEGQKDIYDFDILEFGDLKVGELFAVKDEEELKSILLGLSELYPEFINATFTNDLKTITLRESDGFFFNY